MLAFSKEWIEALAEKLKNDQEYQKAAEGFDSRFQLIIESEPAKGVEERHAVGLFAPKCDEVWEGVKKDVDYTLSGPYGIFIDILNGKIGATKAMVTRKLRLKGNMTNLLKYKRAIDLFVSALGDVETDFEGDYA
jgi:putative sterol carrier protein